jgi:TfoX/Sxy family transcriptional regulator of competence genes
MATKPETIDYLLDLLHEVPAVTAKKMFGEYALYVERKVVALVCDDQLYIKPSAGNDSLAEHCGSAPPYPGAKLYWRLSEERWDEPDLLPELISKTAAALPEPPAKKDRRGARGAADPSSPIHSSKS